MIVFYHKWTEPLGENVRVNGNRGLRPALEVVSDFLRQRGASLERDAVQVIARAGSWAPHRREDRQLITTSLLLFALVESERPNCGNRELRAIIEPFLTTLGRWRGYTLEKKAYFNANIASIPVEDALPSVTRLSGNIQELLAEACSIEQRLGRTRVSAAALAAAFLVARKGVFWPA